MDFHGINMQGYFKLRGVDDASTSDYASGDVGKIVYDETSENLWIADDVGWTNAGQYADTPPGTEMWFYQDAAPNPGWTISVAAGDELIAVKGGSYAVGGTVDGDWDTPSHWHTLGGHGHTFSGTNTGYGSISHGEGDGSNDCANDPHYHSLPGVASQAASPDVTLTNGVVDTYRPRARVGLICSRDA